MDAKTETYLFTFILGLLIGVMACILVGVLVTQAWEREAIRHGHASFVIVDSETGGTVFQWKEAQK